MLRLVSNEVPGKCVFGKGTGEMEIRKWSMQEHQPTSRKKNQVDIVIIIPHAIDLIQLYQGGYYKCYICTKI